jgi:hypothetical protein
MQRVIGFGEGAADFNHVLMDLRVGMQVVAARQPPRSYTTSKVDPMRYPNQLAAFVVWHPLSLVSAVLVELLLANFACAQPLTNTVQEFGLLGTWSDNCSANPAPSNQYASFSITSRGNIMLRNDFGPDYGDMIYRIVDAKRIGEFRIFLRQLLTTDDQIALHIVMVKAKDKIRIRSSRGADGSEYVKDGLVPAANNHETGWMERCGARWAINSRQ